MKLTEKLALAAMFKMDPERGHALAIKALKLGLTPKADVVTTDRLRTTIAGLSLPNPIGLAAGFDKNAETIAPLLKTGFGFIEVGAATPKAQPGNPKPRLFRLREDRASINRFGFNNQGMDAIATRLAARPNSGVVGINLGANKTSENKALDFATVLKTCGPHVDFATVNVSSPNTEKLRDLQGEKALHALLTGVMDMRESLDKSIPIFLKIAPDLTSDEIAQIANVALDTGIDAIIATNTTLDRQGLTSPDKGQAGGLAGEPLFEKSTQVLAQISVATGGRMPLIGVGGVSTAAQAYAKIKAGASAVQLYTALVYGGLSMVGDMAQELDALLAADGFACVGDAVGTDRAAYL